jgi:predicted nuclease of predicted toxin-antitoxin system
MLFLVDENLSEDVADVLDRAGHDVLHVAETRLRGASDRDIWRFAAEEQRILVTRDLDFPLPDHPAPPSVILLRLPRSYRRKQIGEAVQQLVASGALEGAAGAITVFSPGRLRQRSILDA